MNFAANAASAPYVRWPTAAEHACNQTVHFERTAPPAGPALQPECLVTGAQNQLLESLPRRERQRIFAAGELVELSFGEVLYDAGAPTRHVYFPTEGFVSLVAQTAGTAGLEVGMVGCEGMLGVQLALGVVTAPLRAFVQGAGSAWRIDAAPFRRELERSPALQRALHRYVVVLMSQLAASAGCLRYHLIGPRLARWLLMSQDRAASDHFPVTHEFLSAMLGVRRVGVTTAAGGLQKRGLISYHRGQLTVLDRAGLEAAACSCYDADRLGYAMLLE